MAVDLDTRPQRDTSIGRRAMSSTLLLCRRVAGLTGLLAKVEGPVRWMVLGEDADSKGARDQLKALPGALEVDVGALLKRRRERFRKSYIELGAMLNQQNGSLEWWAMPFTSKEPAASSLCHDLALYLAIVELMVKDSSPLLVMGASRDLQEQLRAWCKGQGIRLVSDSQRSLPWRERLRRWLPLSALWCCLTTFNLWRYCRRLGTRNALGERDVVLFSILYRGSFDDSGGYRDTYFGPLVPYLASSGGRGLAVVQVRRPWRSLLARLSRSKDPVPVVPLETFLTLPDILRCLARSLKYQWMVAGLKGDLCVEGVDVAVLVHRAFDRARSSGNIFMALRAYYAAKRLAQRVHPLRCLYPFENRPWEKMVLMGVRHASPTTYMLGYQHAAITSGHINFFLGRGEADVTPLPHRLLTMGAAITQLLEGEGGYPAGVLVTGCALRISAAMGQAGSRPAEGHGMRVLVALGSDLEEYVRVLRLLEGAFADGTNRRLIVRPHPNMRLTLSDAVKASGLSHNGLFTEDITDLAWSLEQADVVVYASSTVSIQAAAVGLPTVCLDLGRELDNDPMGEWDQFKWKASSPRELADVLDQIEALPSGRYRELSARALEYARSYLAPVTEDGLRLFLEGQRPGESVVYERTSASDS